MAAGLVSSRPLLTSNCAPDRLRRLSVDADECPSHIFRVTEADRLRDAFDRFGSRLYAATGYGSPQNCGAVAHALAGTGRVEADPRLITFLQWVRPSGGPISHLRGARC